MDKEKPERGGCRDPAAAAMPAVSAFFLPCLCWCLKLMRSAGLALSDTVVLGNLGRCEAAVAPHRHKTC